MPRATAPDAVRQAVTTQRTRGAGAAYPRLICGSVTRRITTPGNEAW